MGKPRITVFISSTSIDLPEHRAAVRDAILSLDLFPSGMEHWPVSGESPVDKCKEMVDEADIYLGIYAHRYGWRPDGPGTKSITEMEYDWAGEREPPIPCLCFIMKDDHPWPSSRVEHDARADLDAFKTRVKTRRVGFFTSPDDLKAQVTAALAAALKEERNLSSTGAPWWGPGVTFDRYTLDELLDEGGNGQVWRAREKLPDGHYHPVAVKLLKPAISADPQRVERFKQEIAVARRLNHPHILRALDYGLHQGQFYVVMDFIEGKTLRHQINGRPLPTELAIAWLSQIAGALAEAHTAGLIHRDIKPENILYSRRGEIDYLYLTDFGLVYSSDREGAITESGDLVGTGRYMAPEQCDPDFAEVTARTDVYALGIMAYELLTGAPPFSGANKVVLCQKHLHAPLPPHPVLPESLHRILARATAKRPEARYAGVAEFIDHLRRWQEDPANLEPVIDAYLSTLEKRLRDLVLDKFVELAGDEQTLRARLVQAMEDSFDPLAGFGDYEDFFHEICVPVEADHVPARDGERDAAPGEYVPNVRERLMELDRAVLVGEPGSGKTWMLYRVALGYIHAYRQNPARGLIPVLVPLNAYRGGQPFADYVRGRAGALGTHLDALLGAGRIVLLCDALNELPKTYVETIRAYLKPVSRFVVSCRVRDYRDELSGSDMPPLEQVVLRDMELDAIREFLGRRLGEPLGDALWREMGGNEDLVALWKLMRERGRAARFWDAEYLWPEGDNWEQRKAHAAMHSGARLIPLARNPFTAQMICGIYERERTIEKNRAALFERFVSGLLEREAKNAERQGLAFPDKEKIEAALVALARALQTKGRTVLSEVQAREAVLAASNLCSSAQEADALLKAATDASILSQGGDDLRFAHQLLQEYFAVRILVEAMGDPDHPDTAAAGQFFGDEWWDPGPWRETIVILGEFLGGARGANQAARWLAPTSPEVALDVIRRNGAGLSIDSERDFEPETRRLIVDMCLEKIKSGTEIDPRGRAAAGRALDLSGDPRPGVGVLANGLPDIAWGEPVLPGVYPLGHEDEGGNPPRKLELTYSYRLSKYPVTYRQFEAFVTADDGFKDPRWWEGLAASAGHRGAPDEQWFKYWNHPRENVSWYEAMAFCRWLSWRLTGRCYGLDEIEAWPVRLPTENEWEIAARGEDGRLYPYESEFDARKDNVEGTGIRMTSAVGIFPDGASPCGLLDMSGNVLEWCLTKYTDPPSDATASGEDLQSDTRRVVRGGSWNLSQDAARAVFRFRLDPVNRNYILGFRVCRPPSR